jgi:hypothetical protein
MSAELVTSRQARALAAVPRLYAPNPEAARCFIEYFAARIRNPNTRRAYLRAVRAFADWCESQRLFNVWTWSRCTWGRTSRFWAHGRRSPR